uniref:Uncharacterized protein n=1 Tax=Meleagris gallopavo TaxID=9103 RepID=A0A803Y020_MELGA
MFSKKSYDGPPAGYGPPTGYGPPPADYGYGSPPPGSYYVEDTPQHFYKWTSPPGVVRGLQAGVLVLCIAIFACVASTLRVLHGPDFGWGRCEVPALCWGGTGAAGSWQQGWLCCIPAP